MRLCCVGNGLQRAGVYRQCMPGSLGRHSRILLIVLIVLLLLFGARGGISWGLGAGWESDPLGS